jgi:nucleotidyltransferase substrate binding protein (TIGR01987 family)
MRLEHYSGRKLKAEVVRDSANKRFELCFVLASKCIQAHARKEDLDCYLPWSCLKTAVQFGLIENDDTWLKMLDDRNFAVHTYKEKYANEIYGWISLYMSLLGGLARN